MHFCIFQKVWCSFCPIMMNTIAASNAVLHLSLKKSRIQFSFISKSWIFREFWTFHFASIKITIVPNDFIHPFKITIIHMGWTLLDDTEMDEELINCCLGWKGHTKDKYWPRGRDRERKGTIFSFLFFKRWWWSFWS